MEETRNAKHETRNGGRFPLGVCAASIVVTGVGLSFAAMNLRWGIGSGETIGLAWVYVNSAWVLMWMVGWPMLRGRELAWDFSVILAGASPAMIVAGFLSGVTLENIAAMVALQMALALLALGVMQRCGRYAAGVLSVLAVVMPVLVYVCGEFFGVNDAGWLWEGPLVAVTRAADGEMGAGLWSMIGIFLLCGVALIILPR